MHRKQRGDHNETQQAEWLCHDNVYDDRNSDQRDKHTLHQITHAIMNTRYSALVTRYEMKILFVEDNLNTGMAMKVMLELRGHSVDHVTNVKDAIAKL